MHAWSTCLSRSRDHLHYVSESCKGRSLWNTEHHADPESIVETFAPSIGEALVAFTSLMIGIGGYCLALDSSLLEFAVVPPPQNSSFFFGSRYRSLVLVVPSRHSNAVCIRADLSSILANIR